MCPVKGGSFVSIGGQVLVPSTPHVQSVDLLGPFHRSGPRNVRSGEASHLNMRSLLSSSGIDAKAPISFFQNGRRVDSSF